MQRAWATGAEHDQGPMEWIAAISDQSKVSEHIRVALGAALAPDATIGQCQAGMLAIECVTYMQGGDADIDPFVHTWMRDLHPNSDETLRVAALEALEKLRTDSALATHWRTQPEERQTQWHSALDNLRDRLTTAKRKPDPRMDPRIIALGKSFKAAQEHLRVALVAYEITDEPIVHVRVAPGLSVVVHYAALDELEPLAVPIEHARGWHRSAKDLAKLAARRTREVSGLRTHILEHEGFEISLAFGNSSFTAGLLPYANLLLTEGTAPHGMLVAAPNAGTLVYHKIIDAKWNEASVAIIGQVREIYANAPPQISPALWWWHKGKVIELPYAVVADNVIIDPVEEFASYIKKLG
ncbi:MAG: hypothetical protein SFX73_03240 [Kofleriaceae bacterium]|nr:hypothetical protein [Kofleriaceae bacterium]